MASGVIYYCFDTGGEFTRRWFFREEDLCKQESVRVLNQDSVKNPISMAKRCQEIPEPVKCPSREVVVLKVVSFRSSTSTGQSENLRSKHDHGRFQQALESHGVGLLLVPSRGRGRDVLGTPIPSMDSTVTFWNSWKISLTKLLFSYTVSLISAKGSDMIICTSSSMPGFSPIQSHLRD